MTTMDVVNSVNSNPRTPKNTLGKQDFLGGV